MSDERFDLEKKNLINENPTSPQPEALSTPAPEAQPAAAAQQPEMPLASESQQAQQPETPLASEPQQGEQQRQQVYHATDAEQPGATPDGQYGQYTYRATDARRQDPAPGGQYGQYTRRPAGTRPPEAIPGGEYRWKFEDYEAAGQRPIKPPPRRGSGLMVLGTLLACVLVVGVLCLSGYGVYSLVQQQGEQGAQVSSSVQPDKGSTSSPNGPELTIKEHSNDNGQPLPSGMLSTVEIAKRVRSSVVGIVQYSAFNTFTPAGQGSGIIINSDGYIVTNAHVVEGATGINVELDNGETYAAQLIGTDKRTDLAVIKIEAANLVAAEFGDSAILQVGERVVAIGNPGGTLLAGSVSQGIISGVNRTLDDGTYSSTFIQTDAAINPGNSGGALVNEYGQVIGINSAKVAAVEYEGIGFAIPISEAKPILDQLLQFGYVKGRAKLGITGQEINEALSQINGIPLGIYIWSIDPISDLAGKNVTQGDIITAIDGTTISGFADLSAVLKAKNPGERVNLTLYRSARGVTNSGRTFEVTTTLLEEADTLPAHSNKPN